MGELAIERAWEDSDFWFLDAHSCTRVEGHRAEWLDVAGAIESKLPGVQFRRCAMSRERGHVVLWSPRNAASSRDFLRISEEEAAALAAQIRKVFAETPPPKETAE